MAERDNVPVDDLDSFDITPEEQELYDEINKPADIPTVDPSGTGNVEDMESFDVPSTYHDFTDQPVTVPSVAPPIPSAAPGAANEMFTAPEPAGGSGVADATVPGAELMTPEEVTAEKERLRIVNNSGLSVLAGAAQGAMFDWGDEAAAKILSDFRGTPLEVELKEIRDLDEDLKKNPALYNIGYGIGTGLQTIGTNALLRLGQAGNAGAQALAKGWTSLSTAAKLRISSVVTGAATGAGMANDKRKDPGTLAAYTLAGSAAPLATEGGIKAIGAAYNVIKKYGGSQLATWFVSSYMSVPAAELKNYAARMEQVDAVSIDELQQQIIDAAVALNEQKAAKTADVAKAKEALDAAMTRLVEIKSKLKQTELDPGIAIKMQESIERLQTMVNEGSDKALDFLGTFSDRIPYNRALAQFDVAIQEIRGMTSGKNPHTSTQAAQIQKIESYKRDFIADFGPKKTTASYVDSNGAPIVTETPAEDVPLAYLKDKLKRYDAELRGAYDRVSGTYRDASFEGVDVLRNNFDKNILKDKSTPWGQIYDDMMKGVAKDRKMLTVISKQYGEAPGQHKALTALTTLAKKTEQSAMSEIKEFSKRIGFDFDQSIMDYRAAHQMSSEIENILEFGDLSSGAFHTQKNLVDLEKLLPLELRGVVTQLNSVKQHQLVLAEQEETLAKFIAENRRLFKFDNDQHVQALVNRATGGQSRKILALLKSMTSDLSRVTKTDVVQTLRDEATAQAFERNNTQGSRKVNAWKALIGGAAGFLTGGYSYVGGGAGALIGMMMDPYGGKAAKFLIKGYLQAEMLAKTQLVNSGERWYGGVVKSLMDRAAVKRSPFVIEQGTALFVQMQMAIKSDPEMSAMEKVVVLRHMDENGVILPSLDGLKEALTADENKSEPFKTPMERLLKGN